MQQTIVPLVKYHCKADMLMAPSKAPALKGKPWPKSPRTKSPSTSLSLATSGTKMLVLLKN